MNRREREEAIWLRARVSDLSADCQRYIKKAAALGLDSTECHLESAFDHITDARDELHRLVEDARCKSCDHWMDWHWWDPLRSAYVCRGCDCALAGQEGGTCE